MSGEDSPVPSTVPSEYDEEYEDEEYIEEADEEYDLDGTPEVIPEEETHQPDVDVVLAAYTAAIAAIDDVVTGGAIQRVVAAAAIEGIDALPTNQAISVGTAG
jgi:hypothetical protein